MIRHFAAAALLVMACASPEGSGLARAPAGSGARVQFDLAHKPLPEIPLPNDVATRFDPTSPTGRRLNLSTLAPTHWETATRESLNQLDGWGTYQPVTVSFDKPLDLHALRAHHVGDDYAPGDDLVYLLDVTPDSPTFCQPVPLDLGEGNFPLTLERTELFANDRPGDQLLFEDREEDTNHNGRLDLGEDLDMDGVLDHPNTLFPGDSPFHVLSFYERETNTLILRPVMPLREATTYAAVLTRRLVDEDGRPVQSPFPFINDAAQTPALSPLATCLPKLGLGLDDVAFTWAYTTQTLTRDYVAIRDGLYGLGTLQRLATEFPGEIKALLPLRDSGPTTTFNPRIVSGDQFLQAAIELLKATSGGKLTPDLAAIVESHRFIDFHVAFTFESPQFFRRVDSEGNPLPLYRQVFELDPTTGAAFTRPEEITAWLTVPKGRHGPAPMVILGHGYTGNKLDPLFYGGYFARYGMATLGMEAVSHGIGLKPEDQELVRGLLANKGLGAAYDSLIARDRAFDQNGDGRKDSGADFWTAYIPHTRDVLRQSVIDFMQLVRVVRGFDGTRTWKYDANADGQRDLAGDFNGDGVLDVGGGAPIHMTGGSLGGILSSLMAGLEPQVNVAVPVSAGAGLPEVGLRSIQSGVREAVALRMLGPLLVTLKGSAGGLELWQYLPDLNTLGRVKLAVLEGATPSTGDTAVLWNKTTGAFRCFRVEAGGLVRAAVASDSGDPLRLAFFAGALPPAPDSGCRVPDRASPYLDLDTVGLDFSFQGQSHSAGEPLTALGDGFGLRRQSPELRRVQALSQAAVDRADPINFVPNAERFRVLRYGTGEEVSTRVLALNTIGDMNVPVANGSALARAAGLIPLTEKDARYGKTPNRVLIDTGTLEAVERVGRYTNSKGAFVHMDLESFSALSGANDEFDVPRLAPPLRLVRHSNRLGGVVGVLYPMVSPTGRHGFDLPDPSLPFDLGAVLMNMLGRYLQTDGTELPFEACMEKSTCPWVPPLPGK